MGKLRARVCRVQRQESEPNPRAGEHGAASQAVSTVVEADVLGSDDADRKLVAVPERGVLERADGGARSSAAPSSGSVFASS